VHRRVAPEGTTDHPATRIYRLFLYLAFDLFDFLLAIFEACFPRAVLVRFGNRAIVRARLAAAAAFLILRRAAIRCFDDAMVLLSCRVHQQTSPPNGIATPKGRDWTVLMTVGERKFGRAQKTNHEAQTMRPAR